MTILIHGENGHPVSGAGPQAELLVLLPHRVGEDAAARHHQQSMAAAQLDEVRAQFRQACPAAEAAAHLDDRVDHDPATAGLAASRRARRLPVAPPPRSPRCFLAGSTARPRRPATSAARKAPTPAGATAASVRPARHDLQEPVAHDPQLAFDQVARDLADLGLAQHLAIGAHEARQALRAGGRRGISPVRRGARVVRRVQATQEHVGVRHHREVFGGDPAGTAAHRDGGRQRVGVGAQHAGVDQFTGAESGRDRCDLRRPVDPL